MYGLMLIITLSITGGFIAYFGDIVGRKVGRKKLSFAGLRPKHTGIVVSMVTGTLISLFSITILAIVSEDVRIALFDMHVLQEALTNSEVALETSLWETQNAIEHIEQLQLEKATLETDIEGLNERVETAQEEVATYYSIAIELDSYAKKLQKTSFSFLANEIIHAFILPAEMSNTLLQQEVLNQVLEAHAIAFSRGSEPISDGGLAISLMAGELNQAISMIAEYLSEQNVEHIVRITSAHNSPKELPVQFFFDIFPNEQVFYGGEMLTEIIVNPGFIGDPYVVAFELLNDANALAIQHGIITESGMDAILLPGKDFFSIIDFINLGGEGTIQLVASDDTWRVDNPVHLFVEIHTSQD